MNTTSRISRAFLPVVVAALVSTGTAWGAEGTAAKPRLYDEKLDGSKQIAEALVVAKKEHKRVLLQFGANWCGWCHLLHKLFESDDAIRGKLKTDFVTVLIDVNQGHNSEVDRRYGNPTKHGLPVLVVLDAEGKALVTQETGALEEGNHHDPKKVMAFLKKWGTSP